MASEKSVMVRDKLASLIEEVMADGNRESHVIACCLSVGLEELEKWMYNGDFTPSVSPYLDGREFLIPFEPEEESDDFTGPPWNREKIPIMSRHPALKEAIEKAKTANAKSKKLKGFLDKRRKENGKSLSSLLIHEWEEEWVDAFRKGDRAELNRKIRLTTNAPMKEIVLFIADSVSSYSCLWGIDRKPGDVCPDCGEKDIKTGPPRTYWCQNCGTAWGPLNYLSKIFS